MLWQEKLASSASVKAKRLEAKQQGSYVLLVRGLKGTVCYNYMVYIIKKSLDKGFKKESKYLKVFVPVSVLD